VNPTVFVLVIWIAATVGGLAILETFFWWKDRKR